MPAPNPRKHRKLSQRGICSDLLEQRERSIDAILRRLLEPFECSRVATPHDDVEQGRREINPSNLRLAMRPQNVALVPQSDRASGGGPARSARALIGRVARDPPDNEMIDG